MGIDLLEVVGTPPPVAVAALALGLAVLAVGLARRLRRGPLSRVGIRLSD